MPVLISVNMDKEEVCLAFENYNLVSAGVSLGLVLALS